MLNDRARVAVLHWHHEATTFIDVPCNISRFEAGGPLLRGPELLASPYSSGFARIAALLGWIEPIGIASPREPLAGSSLGIVPRDTFEHYWRLWAADIAKLGPFDAVYCDFHGASAVEDVPHPEAEIAARLRSMLGEVPLVATLDLHANQGSALAREMDAIIAIKRFPHYDCARAGERAALVLAGILRGTFRPTMAYRKLPIAFATVLGDTARSPALEIMERARIWEDRAPGTIVSVVFGYPWADVRDIGMAVFVTTHDDMPLAEHIADEVATFIAARKDALAGVRFPDAHQAVQEAVLAQKAGETPVILADYSDRYGDATWALSELLAANADRFLIATLVDPEAVDRLAGHGQGKVVELAVGGRAAVSSGAPVRVRGEVERIVDPGTSGAAVVLRLRGQSRIILSTALVQVTEPRMLHRYGICDGDHEIIVLKSRVHFRAGFDEGAYAAKVLLFDPGKPFLGTVQLSALPYRNVPPGTFPINA